jgi:hypothetical protein
MEIEANDILQAAQQQAAEQAQQILMLKAQDIINALEAR